MWKTSRKKSRGYKPPNWAHIISDIGPEMLNSDFFENLKNDLCLPDGPIRLVCLGIGSLTNSRSARHQLALIDCFLDFYKNMKFEIIFDPAFTAEDLELIKAKYPNVKLEPIEEWKLENGIWLVYLPHVPLWLLDQFLNLHKTLLNQMIIISNDLNSIKDTQSKSGKLLYF